MDKSRERKGEMFKKSKKMTKSLDKEEGKNKNESKRIGERDKGRI